MPSNFAFKFSSSHMMLLLPVSRAVGLGGVLKVVPMEVPELVATLASSLLLGFGVDGFVALFFRWDTFTLDS